MHADAVEELRERLRRHTPDLHPLKHATAQFHLGGLLLAQDDLEEAETAFATAAALFGARGAQPERAKALNGLGATLRAAGRLDLAARALEHAAAGLASAGLALEEGAARFNLGLALHEAGDPQAAVAELVRAAELLDPRQVPGQAASAMRELGAAQLSLGEQAAAQVALTTALELADRVGDQAARGAAANGLGLARLAEGRAASAADAFRIAVAASPRSLRPEAFAMAKANLAVALEQAGDPAPARLAARQALSAPGAPEPVRVQAAGVIDRLGHDVADLRTVLEGEPADEGRALIVREELVRSAEAADGDRQADARAWVGAHAASARDPADLAELWLGGLLELPPDGLERLARDAVEASAALDDEAREAFRAGVTRAMARFHVPQWMRLQDVFSRAADELDDPGPWR